MSYTSKLAARLAAAIGSSTSTLTNKTFDAAAAGNSVSNIDLTTAVTGSLPLAMVELLTETLDDLPDATEVGTAISGAATATYNVDCDGNASTARPTAANSDATVQWWNSPTRPVNMGAFDLWLVFENVAPILASATTSPTGTVQVGAIVTVTGATYSNEPYPDPTLSYQWKLDTVAIGGATASSYTTAAAGSLTCDVTATNSSGADTIATTAVTVEAAAAVQVIGATGYWNATGATVIGYQIALPAGAVAGDLCILTATWPIGTATWPTGFSYLFTPLAVFNTSGGNNLAPNLASGVLTSTHIANGYIQLTQNLPGNLPVSCVVLRGGATITLATPADNQAGPGSVNSIALIRPTAPAGGVALSFTMRGGGHRTATLADWTSQNVAQNADTGSTTNSHYGTYIHSLPVSAGITPAGTISFSGSANMTIANATVVVSP